MQANLAKEPLHENANTSIAMDAKGDVLVAWSAPVANYEAIKVAWRPAGGAFGAPIVLSPVGDKAFDPVVAMDPQGDVTVAWLSQLVGKGDAVETAWRAAGEAFTSSVELTPTEENIEPAVAMDSRGDAIIAWAHYNDLFYEITAAYRPPGGAFGQGFGASRPLSGNPDENIDAQSPTVALDAQGNATIAWSAHTLDSTYQKILPDFGQVSTRRVGENLTPPMSFEWEHAAVVANPSGETLVTLNRNNGGLYNVDAVVRPEVHGAFGFPLGVFSTGLSEGERITSPAASLDANGEATVVLRTSHSVTAIIRQIGGAFGKPVVLADAFLDTTAPPALATDERGDSMVMWTNPAGGHELVPVVEASPRPAGGQFGPPLQLGVEGTPGQLHVAVDSQGDAAAAWISATETTDVLQLAGYEASGPQLEALQVPSEGQTGAGLAFSVAPRSVWSDVASTTWSWGDGSANSSGTNVEHVFTSPGVYSVSLTSTDSKGNSSSTSRLVTIQSPADITSTLQPPVISGANTVVHRSEPVAPELVVRAFTPLFATQASTSRQPLGRIVGIARIRGAANGDTVVVRCLVACQRPLRETWHVRPGRNSHGAGLLSPPLIVTRATRLRVELRESGRVTRFVDYGFARTKRGVIPHPTNKGCLWPSGALRACP